MCRFPSLNAAVAVSLLAALSVPLAAQQPQPPPQPLQPEPLDEAAVFRSDSRLVVLHTTVLDVDGQLVKNLPQSSFRVFENGVSQEIKLFSREDAPVSLGFVIDDSGSMTNKREKVAAAALALLRQSHPGDEAFVVHFNEKTYLDTDFTRDHNRLKQGLERFDSRGTTAVRDAVRLAIEHLNRKASEDKKVLVVITDGEDNTSHTTRDFVVKTAQQAGVLVYTIGILTEIDDEKTRLAERELTALARATGGRPYFLKDVAGVDETAREIATVIRNQYTLAYSPANEQLDGTYRSIEVQVQAPVPVQVLTRAGYYAVSGTSAKADGASDSVKPRTQ
jgi:VWFA-related protein